MAKNKEAEAEIDTLSGLIIDWYPLPFDSTNENDESPYATGRVNPTVGGINNAREPKRRIKTPKNVSRKKGGEKSGLLV